MTTPIVPRHRSADVVIGFAADANGAGIVYLAVASSTGRAVAKCSFRVAPATRAESAIAEAATALVAVEAAGAYLVGRGFTRVYIAVDAAEAVDVLNGRCAVDPALAGTYVRVRCLLHGFAVARVEHPKGEGVTVVHDLTTRAQAEIALRAPVGATT